jgi:hypothetical protein
MTTGRRLLEWSLVLLGAAIVSAALTFLPAPVFRADQHAYNLLVSKTLEPDLFARDVLYHHDPALLHVPWFIHLHAAVARRLGGDPERALVALAWPMGMLYLVGHYALFRAVSGSPLAAGLAAIGALTVRNALGGEFWGFDGVPSAATRTILAGLTPLLFLVFLRWRGHPAFSWSPRAPGPQPRAALRLPAFSWSPRAPGPQPRAALRLPTLPLFYLGLGLLFNVHPVSAYHLAQVTAVAHLWAARFRVRSLAEVAGGMVLFGLGALPYVVRFFPARDNVTDPALLPLVRRALDLRFPYLLYPISLDALFSVAFHAAFPFAAWLAWRRLREGHPAMAGLHVIAAAAVVLGFAGPAVIEGLGLWLDRPYLDIQQLRTVRLVYPVLLCGLALLYARLLARGTWRARAVVAALVLASLVPPASVIHLASHERRQAVKAALGIGAPPPTWVPSAAPEPGADEALWSWTRASTPRSALFLSDDFNFRQATHRSITGSFKDGALLFLTGSRPFLQWEALMQEIDACRARLGRDCWFALGRRLQVDYAIVDRGLSDAGAPCDFQQVWTQGGLAVWKRSGKCPVSS